MRFRSRKWRAGNLRDVLAYWEERLPPRTWHAGRTVGRTLYKGWGGAEDMLGVLDDPEHAKWVACMRNILPDLIEMATEVDRYDGEALRWADRGKLSKIWEVLRGRDDSA